MVDLKAKPYYLSDSQIAWVEQTIASLTLEEKIGQLFINLFADLSPDYVRNLISKYPVGGARYMGADSKTVYAMISELQKQSKVPLLVSCNCDSGGNGACKDGTYIASGAATEASGSEQVAYHVGLVSGREAAAIGCNWNFDPCVDILFNWRNTIVNTRAYGTDADTVYKYASQYIKGIQQSNIATCVKHFPGDGTEERDQHLVLGVNELSVEAWDASFGKVYKQVKPQSARRSSITSMPTSSKPAARSPASTSASRPTSLRASISTKPTASASKLSSLLPNRAMATCRP